MSAKTTTATMKNVSTGTMEQSVEIHLAAALWYLAGGSYLDITISYGVGKTDVYRSVWAVVHATNNCNKLQFRFPTTVEEYTELASEFTF